MGLLAIIDGQLDQPARIGMDGRFAQLRRVHLAQALEAGHADRALDLLALDLVQHGALFFFIQRVEHLLAHVDAEQRRHRHEHMAGIHQRREVLQEQRGEQGGDVQAVRIGVGQDHHLAVAQAADVFLARIATDGDGQVVHFFGSQHAVGGDLPGVQDLAAQRHDGLEVLVAGLLGAAAGRVTFHQEQLGAGQVLADAVGQLAGQGGALGDLLAHHQFFGLQARAGAFDRQLRDALADFHVLVQQQAEGIVRGAFDETGGLARRQAFLGLPAELRVGHLDRQHEGDPVPDVFRGQLDAARQQVAEVAELAQRLGQAGTQAVDVGAVLGGGDQVDVAFLHQLAFGHPRDGPVGDLVFLLDVADEQVARQHFPLAEFQLQVVAQTVLVMPGVHFAGGFVGQLDRQPRAQHGLGAQQVLERAHRELGRVEVLRIRPEAQAGAGILLAHAADHFQRRSEIAIAEGDAVLGAFALDVQFHQGGQRVDHADAHAMQAAGEGVVVVVELAACMQAGQDQFHAGDLLFRVDVHRHAAAVIADFHAAILVQGDLDGTGVAGQRFVHRVVDHFLRQVVRAGGVGVHAGAALDRVKAGQDFDIGGVIAGVHLCFKALERRASVRSGQGFCTPAVHLAGRQGG